MARNTTRYGLMGVSLIVAVGAPILAVAGCTEGKKPDASPPPASAAPSSRTPPPPAEPTESRGSDEIHPVYPVDAGPPDPLAQRLCEALHALPARRVAECCGGTPGVGAGFADQCVRMLSYSMGAHTVTLASARVDACVEAMAKATAGCDWVTPANTVPVPPECEGIIDGTLKEKAQCRSSLECADGMRCEGLSTIDLGACGHPKATGQPCNLAVDPLAGFTRQDDLNRTHPECTGVCGRTSCLDPVPEGGKCASDIACGKLRCEAGKCTAAPLPREGEACSAACAYGLRCQGGKCAAPKPEGAACSSNAECRGVCDRGDGGATGACQKTCTFAWPFQKPPAPAPSGAPVHRKR